MNKYFQKYWKQQKDFFFYFCWTCDDIVENFMTLYGSNLLSLSSNGDFQVEFSPKASSKLTLTNNKIEKVVCK